VRTTTRSVVLSLAIAAGAFPGEHAVAGDGPTVPMPGAIAGKVIHVNDGDTLVVLDAQGHKRVIRLTDIDAPESAHGARRPGQPYSAKATAHLKSIALSSPAEASCYDIDARRREDGSSRERYICRVFVNGVDVNMAMIDAGLAMAYRQNRRYVRDQATFQHEDAARAARMGLWQHSTPIPPWEWRRTCWERRQCDGAGD